MLSFRNKADWGCRQTLVCHFHLQDQLPAHSCKKSFIDPAQTSARIPLWLSHEKTPEISSWGLSFGWSVLICNPGIYLRRTPFRTGFRLALLWSA